MSGWCWFRVDNVVSRRFGGFLVREVLVIGIFSGMGGKERGLGE